MINSIYSFGIILLGLIVGQTIKKLHEKNVIRESVHVGKYMRAIQMVALLGINPVISIGAFWIVSLNDTRYIALPILGFCAIGLGGVFGLTFSKVLKHDRKQTGSMFVSGSFTNMGTFGGLICFAFFGEGSYAYVSMYKLLEEFAYYPIGYPIAKLYGSDFKEADRKNNFLKVISDPFIAVYLISISLGVALNFSGIVRPASYQSLNSILIPLSSIILVVPVGYNMKIKAISRYLKECFSIAAVKFVLIPTVITSAAYFMRVGTMQEGLILKITLVLSAMPPAFNSLIPPQIYNLDSDLANSCWLFCTGSLVFVVPLLYFIASFI